MYARKAMFPEGGDADATATYVSMYWECVKGVGACIHVFFFKYLDMFVSMYISISIFIFVIGRNQMKTVSVCLYLGMPFRTVSLCEVILSRACSTRIVRTYPMMFSRIATTYIHCSEVLMHYKHSQFESI